MKCRSIRRKAGPERWNQDLFSKIKGTPWEPLPGRNSIEVPISVQVPEEDAIIIPQTLSQEREISRRDFRIYKQDVKDHGLTPGCRGCLAADSNGAIARNHTPECRSRFMKIFEEIPERFEKITEQYLRKHQGEPEKQVTSPVTVVDKEEDLPEDEDANMEELGAGARGSDDAQGSRHAADNDDINMSNIIYSITASKESAMNWDSWESNYKQKIKHGIGDDIIKMNQALAKEGFNYGIIEAYSPKRVNAMGELMGLIPGLSVAGSH